MSFYVADRRNCLPSGILPPQILQIIAVPTARRRSREYFLSEVEVGVQGREYTASSRMKSARTAAQLTPGWWQIAVGVSALSLYLLPESSRGPSVPQYLPRSQGQLQGIYILASTRPCLLRVVSPSPRSSPRRSVTRSHRNRSVSSRFLFATVNSIPIAPCLSLFLI